MIHLTLLLAAYGICFGFMNEKLAFLNRLLYRLPVVRDKDQGTNLFDRMSECAYCSGFHSGWFVFLTHSIWEGRVKAEVTVETVLFAFASGAFCYTLDTALRWLEVRS